MNGQIARPHRDSLVGREELERLSADYRHLLQEHRRAHAGSRTRRRLDHELLGLSDRFERLLAHTPVDDETRAQWRAHLHHGAPAPAGPEPGEPVYFCGRSATDAELVIRRLGPRELDVLVDGTRVERLTDADELGATSPPLAFRVGDQVYEETFAASAPALAALAEALENGRPAPADAELLLDGLVDRELSVTPRGRRALALAARVERETPAVGAPIEIVTRGRVGKRARARLHTELARVVRAAPRSPLLVRGTLTYDGNPSLARPATATATLRLGGRTVRAHAEGAGTSEAIDLLVERLHRELRELRGREVTTRRVPAVAEPGHWRHGNLPPASRAPSA